MPQSRPRDEPRPPKSKSRKDTAREEMFGLFDRAARIAQTLEDRGLATVALGAAMLAAEPPRQRAARKGRAR